MNAISNAKAKILANQDPLAVLVFALYLVANHLWGFTVGEDALAMLMVAAASARALWEKGRSRDYSALLAELDAAREQSKALAAALREARDAEKPAELSSGA